MQRTKRLDLAAHGDPLLPPSLRAAPLGTRCFKGPRDLTLPPC